MNFTDIDIQLPDKKINQDWIDSDIAYSLINDELMDEGNARMNLATFCQTHMEDNAIKLMSETLEKNAIDKSEYPQTTEIENRCINIIADLWNAEENSNYIGTSTVGSSEACMLAGMAMKFSWEEKATALGIDTRKKKPNLIISSAYQVCWKKFSVYHDVDLKIIPLEKDNLSLNIDQAINAIDEYTIGIVGILGITYTGKYDNIFELDRRLEIYNSTAKLPVYIHVDGASGGLFTPFVDKDLIWDFRLKNVISINTSGHKYGLVYPGIGWVIWRDKKYLPQKMIFEVSYLGGMLPTIAINFSRSASQIIGQYYIFVRYGFNGLKLIHEKTRNVAMYLATELDKLGLFTIYNDGKNIPIVCYRLKENLNLNWTLYDLADRIAMKGWQIPAYPLPKDVEDIKIQRIVVRADMGINRGEQLIKDIKEAIEQLNEEKEYNLVHGFIH
ncbi:glutamate decarboxylase [uncultured Clostridium sp.]|uniref:glutamate decarboxylase n=1 Tax=uncultured Clostridium sp. TaxID=59620 RepID=UPI002620B0B5|nr:glutamate decarboxylase [uncultured Clostridium sp.]